MTSKSRPTQNDFSPARTELGRVATAQAGNLARMPKQAHATDKAPAAIGPYSQAMKADGRLVFLSGQIPLRPDGSMAEGDVRVQTEQVMQNIEGLLESLGLGFNDIVKTTIFLSDMAHFATVNEVYGARFQAEPPARSTVAVAGLPRGVDVEIECIALW